MSHVKQNSAIPSVHLPFFFSAIVVFHYRDAGRNGLFFGGRDKGSHEYLSLDNLTRTILYKWLYFGLVEEQLTSFLGYK